MGSFDKPRNRLEVILMDIRDGKSTSLGKPWNRLEAILMQIRDNGGAGGTAAVATDSRAGLVRPDGTTLTVDGNGVLSLAVENADEVSY